jgi:putative transposase
MNWVTIRQVTELENITMNAAVCRYRRGWYKTRLADKAGGNGRRNPLISVESLSPEAQRRWAEKIRIEGSRDVGGKGEGLKDSRIKGASFNPSTLQSIDPGSINELPAWAREEMVHREEIVQQVHGAWSRNGKGRDEIVKEIAAQYLVSPGTLYRWIQSYKRHGITGLAPRNGEGHRGRTKMEPTLKEFVLAQWLSPQRPRMTRVHRRLQEFSVQQKLPCPSYSATRRLISAIPVSVAIYYREGEEAWRQKAMPKSRRDLNASAPGEWYVGDHREFDVFVKIRTAASPDQPGGGWRTFRPWVSAWQDIGSRDMVGWHICEAPNSSTIALAARQAILTFGRPKHWYYDNGKDYRSHYLSGKDRSFGKISLSKDTMGIFRMLGSEIHLARVYSPWAKPIERLFGYLPEWEKTLPGWCGKDNKERPEKLEGEIKSGALLTFNEFCAAFSEWVKAYRDRPHGELGTSPGLKWQGVPREIPDTRALDLLLMEAKEVRVHSTGIRMHGYYFWSDELAVYIGQGVTVRYDRNEAGRLYVYQGNHFVCEATNKPLLKMGASREALQAAAREQARARRLIKQHPELLRKVYSKDMALAEAIGKQAQTIRAEERIKGSKDSRGNFNPSIPQSLNPSSKGPMVPLMTKFDAMARETEKGRIKGLKDRRGKGQEEEELPTPQEQREADEEILDLVKLENAHREKIKKQIEQKAQSDAELLDNYNYYYGGK